MQATIHKLLAILTLFAITSPLSADMITTESEAHSIGKEVAIYGYPLVMMDITKHRATYASSPGEYAAPINQFAHTRSYPSTSFNKIPSPSVDTLSSMAWLDLSDGPIVLHLPSIPERYFLVEVLDAWTNVIGALGPRSSGTAAQDFLICGPNFSDEVPPNMTKIVSATNMVWICGRIQCNGSFDYPGVIAIQNQFKLTPLKYIDQDYVPPTNVTMSDKIPGRGAPSDQIADMQAVYFFNRLSKLLQTNPPATCDAVMVEKMARLGMGTGKTFDLEDTPPAVERGLKRAFHEAIQNIASASCSTVASLNYWKMCVKNVGNYQADYLLRASYAFALLGANSTQDVIYAWTDSDSSGNWLTGTKNYLIQFPADSLPPVNAFWSITLYDEQNTLVTNSFANQAIRSYDEWLVVNDDGSLNILIQSTQPSDTNTNWLTAPRGKFTLVLRLYWPQDSAQNGSWIPPKVKCLLAE